MIAEEERDAHRRATERARAILRPEDRITVTHCPGTKRWVVFSHFDGEWICSKTRDDFHAWNVSKINGVPVSFRI